MTVLPWPAVAGPSLTRRAGPPVAVASLTGQAGPPVTGQAGPLGLDPAGTGGGPASPGGARGGSNWRRWRAPAVLVALILLGGVTVALLQAGPTVVGPLDPRAVGPGGSHALAALLAGQGKHVSRVETAAAAVAQSQRPGTVLVITDPGVLDSTSLAALSTSPADLVIVEPGTDALYALAPGVTVARGAPARIASRPPRCALPAARLAGTADMGGLLLRTTARGAWLCYRVSQPAGRHPTGGGPATFASLVRFQSGGHIVTVLGTGAPLTNADLGRDGNAALALNLLGQDSRVVWLVPSPLAGAAASGPHSVTGLIPGPVYLVTIELAVAVMLAALWRMRRFGPLVFEPLPVVVRASETVEGHGGLYRSRRARDRAAAALRAATLARITTRIGLPPETSPEVTCQELAGRTGRGTDEIRAMLFGPVPGDDAALVILATDLDTLEGQVLTQ